ncbi:MAG: Rv2993c-like domain-containing protein, partial [Dehalococcoidales bacterium]
MKIIRYLADRKIEYGILDGEQVQALDGDPFAQIKKSGRSCALKDVKLLSPCAPSKIVAIGLNYHAHAKEVNQ